MTDDKFLELLADDLKYIRERTDDNTKEVAALRDSVQHRLTKVESKASLLGLLAGLLSALGVHMFRE